MAPPPYKLQKNLAELKANRVSSKFLNDVVIGADQTLDLNGKNIDKPKNLEDAKNILRDLNNQTTCFTQQSVYLGQEV